MKSTKSGLSSRYFWPALILFVFVISRYLTWHWRPLNFSEILYSYMPYAHLWASGTRPYLDQWYEYPPATIPLFYLPHIIDMTTLNYWYHLDYGQVYRLQMLAFDTLTFLLIWRTLIVLKVKRNSILLALGYYLLATLKAHDFIYDTMDISFSFFILASATLPIIFQAKLGRLSGWLAYFVAVALKLLNAPLAILYLLLDKRDWFKSAILAVLAGMIVWLVPLALYRSSLQVLLVYQNIRGLQIDTAGAVVGRVINTFSHSESIVEVYKNYELTGPYAHGILTVLNLALPISIAVFVLFFGYKIIKAPKISPSLRISLTLGYILLLMLVSKVLSRPFMLWHIPLLAVLPFASAKERVGVYLTSLVAVAATMSALPNTIVLGLPIPLWAGITRTICFLSLFGWWLVRLRAQGFVEQK